MWPVSDAFKAALRKSPQVVTTRVEILELGDVIATLTNMVTGGDVQMDSNSDIDRSLAISLLDPLGTYTPATYADLLAPNGNEVRVWRGLRGFTDDEVPLFTGQIDSDGIEAGSQGGVFLSIEAFDRGQAVADSGFDTTYQVNEGLNYADAIQALISSRVGGLEYRFMTTSHTTPLLVFQPGDDPWKKAKEMAEAIGARLRFDGLGVCVLEPVPTIEESDSVFDYVEGETSTLLSTKKKLTRQYTYNGVVATGETPTITDQATAPVTATVWDENPDSPTYYQGKFGKKPRRYASPLLTTVDQCRSAALAILQASLGLSESVSFDAIVNPAHEPGDIVMVTDLQTRVSDRYVMDSFSIPLGHDSNLSASTRRTTGS